MSEKGSSKILLWVGCLCVAVYLLFHGVKDDIEKSSTSTAAVPKPTATDDSALAKAANRGIETAALFDNSKRKLWFFLTTSWIPGENAVGVMRYRVTAFAADPISPSANSLFLRRAQYCTMSAEITDNQDFKLRSIPLQFSAEENDDHQVTGLEANDSVQMSKTEYKSISVTNPAWSLTWRCP